MLQTYFSDKRGANIQNLGFEPCQHDYSSGRPTELALAAAVHFQRKSKKTSLTFQWRKDVTPRPHKLDKSLAECTGEQPIQNGKVCSLNFKQAS